MRYSTASEMCSKPQDPLNREQMAIYLQVYGSTIYVGIRTPLIKETTKKHSFILFEIASSLRQSFNEVILKMN